MAPLRFEDVTARAGGVDGGEAWGTGATFVDIDGDGTPELFDQYKLLRMVNTRYRLVEDIEPPYFDCPC